MGVVGFPEFRDDGESELSAASGGVRFAWSGARSAFDGAESVEDGFEAAAGDDRGVEQLERAGRGVARVGEGRFAVFFAPGVERGEFFLGQINLAADFDEGGGLACEFQRDAADGADVLRDVVAGRAVAAGGGEFEQAVAVGQREGDAVDFGFDGPAQFDVGQQFLHARHERVGFLERVGVVEALHGHAMPHLREALERATGHALGRRIGRAEVGVRGFEILQLAQKSVEFTVGDLGCRFVIVEPVVVRDLAPEFTDAG